MDRKEFLDTCSEVFEKNGIPLTGGDEELEKYYRLSEILVETNKKMNLTAITDMNGIIVKHIADSLKLLEYISEKDKSVADIGCGGGFPLLPCAISASYRFQGLTFTGFDSTKKKVDHVNACIEALGLSNASAVCGRAEELARMNEYRERFDVGTARAVSEQYILSELCLPFVKKGGRMIALKGAKGKEELACASSHMKRLGAGNISLVEYELLGGDIEEYRCVILCDKTRITEKTYPRQYAKILSEAKK